MKILLVPMALFMIALTGGLHYLVFTSLDNYIGLGSGPTRTSIIVLFYVMAVGFFLMSAFGHYLNNPVVKFGYITSAAWYGLISNLAWMSAVIWVLSKLNNRYGFFTDIKPLAIILLLLGVGLTVYAAWAARSPQVHRINVKIDNLAPEWSGKTAVQLSDLHLGLIYGPKWITRLVGRVNAMDPDLVFITGDY